MYKKKYLKYKLKYLNLKKKQKGGSNLYKIFNTLEETDLNYEKLMSELDKENNKIIIVCYAPWCIHCQNFIDRENSVYSKLIKNNKINIYKIDFTNEGEDLDNIKKKLIEYDEIIGQILGFPTLLKIDTERKIIDNFKGDRNNIDNILEFFNK